MHWNLLFLNQLGVRSWPKVAASGATTSVRYREFPRLNWHAFCREYQWVSIFPDLLNVAQNEKSRLNTFKPAFQNIALLCGL